MYTYSDTDTYVSLVRTMPDLTRWTLTVLLSELGDLTVRLRDAAAANDEAEHSEVSQDMAAVTDEIERRTTPAAEVDVPSDLPVATYVRRTVDRLTEVTRKPDQDFATWDYCHLLGVVTYMDVAGHGDAVRAAADRLAADYDLPTQTEVEQVPSEGERTVAA